jgi:glutathione S-transferase
MFAPVVTRLRTYGVKVDKDTDAYCTAVMNHPAMKDWIDAAKHEPWLISEAELA